MRNFRLKIVSFIIWKTTQIMSFVVWKRVPYHERHLKSFLVWQTIATEMGLKRMFASAEKIWNSTQSIKHCLLSLVCQPLPRNMECRLHIAVNCTDISLSGEHKDSNLPRVLSGEVQELTREYTETEITAAFCNLIWVIGSRRLMPIENCRGLS